MSLLGAPIGGVGAAPPNIIIISIILVDAGRRPRCDRNFRHVWNFSAKFKLTFIINLINSSVGNGTWPWDSPGPGMMRTCWDSQEDFNVLINCLSLSLSLTSLGHDTGRPQLRSLDQELMAILSVTIQTAITGPLPKSSCTSEDHSICVH